MGGDEGAWLRHELAIVVQDLLAWAHEDIRTAASPD